MIIQNLFNDEIFKQVKCLNATAFYVAKQQNFDVRKIGLSKEALEYAKATLIKHNLLQDDDVVLEFEQFWQIYGKHGNKKNALSAFKKLTKKDRQMVMQNVMEYVKSTPNKQYRKHAQGYLNGRMFDVSNFQINGSQIVVANNFEVRLQSLLMTLKKMGYVKDIKGNHLTNEQQIREFLEREKHFKSALSKLAQDDFGVSIHDEKIQKGGAMYHEFINKRQKLIEQYF